MACPYFRPISRADRPGPARTPLGGLFDGVCVSRPEVHAPDERTLYEECNFGYGRGVCPSFPQDATADALRFTLLKGSLIYVYERDHSPVEHGIVGPDSSVLLQKQAAAFTSGTPH